MKNKKYLTLIGISSSLLIGTSNAKITSTQNDLASIDINFETTSFVNFKNNSINSMNSITGANTPEIPEQQNYSLNEIYNIYNKYCSGYETCLKNSNETAIQRVLHNTSQDLAILFVGFDQLCPTEGSEIQYNTPGYRKSIFTSVWYDCPDINHYNSLQADFSEYPALLTKTYELYNFFDYIIIGGQTTEYIPAETWECLGQMLKPNGIMLFKHYYTNGLVNGTITQFDAQKFIDFFVSHHNPFHFNSYEYSSDNTNTNQENLSEIEQKIELALKLSEFNNEGSSGSDPTQEHGCSSGGFCFTMRPINLHIIHNTGNIRPIQPIQPIIIPLYNH